MDRQAKTAITVLIAFAGLMVALQVFVLPTIARWERANDYPFGRMCDSPFTLWVDTCPKMNGR